MRTRANLSGKRFGRLLVIGKTLIYDGKVAKWEVACDCGVVKFAGHHDLLRGDAKSCGCLKLDMNRQRLTIHGHTNSPEYRIWSAMKTRCNNHNQPMYAYYGGRGIKVCDRWQSFENFLADMGPKPSTKHSIERIDVNRGYEPENCKWIPLSEQASNTRKNRYIECRGERKTLSEWSRISGRTASNIHTRIFIRGWEPEKAIFAPNQKPRRYKNPQRCTKGHVNCTKHPPKPRI